MSINGIPMKTILILTANPKGTTSLRLDQEVRDISESLRRSQHRDRFALVQRWAVRPRDVQRAILEVNPEIVHFSGHGSGEDGLVFEDEVGKTKFVDAESLAGLFELVASEIECVILNACYSEIQAEAIAQHISYVIGMNQPIGDNAALEFAFGFYDALGGGRDFEFAYKWGRNSIRMAGIPAHLTPVLKKSPKLSATVKYITSKHSNLDSWQRRQLEKEREGLQQQYDLFNEKLRRLRNTIAIETDEAVCFKLEKQIERTQLECKRLDEQLEIINNKLQ
ncbi:CHAT domain-containing protein [Nostoc sp. S13]|uniref:CHAT domain-containing protein n=2 Tax=unclassified Nostoc TaxID=2593658 RepID=UPI00262AFEF1|nr:CHAT domain-containing protein [Nostoc sp. S13]